MDIIKLGQIVKDDVTGCDGMLTVFSIDLDSNKHYLFQPSSLNPKTKEPVDSFWITRLRISPPYIGALKLEVVDIDLPLDVLNTIVEDKATGFKGKVVSLLYSLNGCIHADVKPNGVIEETNEPIRTREFDLRRLKGDKIAEMINKELENSKIETPSPEYHPKIK